MRNKFYWHELGNSMVLKVLLTCSYLCAGVAHGETNEQPNILLILADDLGYSDLGCYGGEINTPNIDRLAGDGARFTQLYNSARCCPSRASLMTGLYPTQAGIGDFTTRNPNKRRGPGYLGRLNDNCATLAEVLKPAGYECFYVGKWHLHTATGPIKRGFEQFYGYTNGYAQDQYNYRAYQRLPGLAEGTKPEVKTESGDFYATDVFNRYAIEFIKQGQNTANPWFLFLGHSSPHFPVQAPAKLADKYDSIYQQGWDVLSAERFERMKEIGLANGRHWRKSPRSIVPVDKDNVTNGFSGRPNPAWDELAPDRQRDLARRMAVYAAMVEAIDSGVGSIVDHLRQTNDLDNTLILFLSDNGACYEWGPFGFDGPSRKGRTDLRTGDELQRIGQKGTYQSYGSGWAGMCNTPFKMYKHFTDEGGISTPFVVHWPDGIGKPDEWIRSPCHLMDLMPTILDAAGARYPAEISGHKITPFEGISLLPAIRGEHLRRRFIGFNHQSAHALRDGNWKLIWSKRMPYSLKWELYNLATDRCEQSNVADQNPERVEQMASQWKSWARRVGVTWSQPK